MIFVNVTISQSISNIFFYFLCENFHACTLRLHNVRCSRHVAYRYPLINKKILTELIVQITSNCEILRCILFPRSSLFLITTLTCMYFHWHSHRGMGARVPPAPNQLVCENHVKQQRSWVNGVGVET